MSSSLVLRPSALKLGAIGTIPGEGRKWDDGSDNDAVTKIYVTVGTRVRGIKSIDYEIVKDGDLTRGGFTLLAEEGEMPHEFVINHPEEYVVSLGVWRNNSAIAQGIRFKTNQKDSGCLGNSDGEEYTLQVEDRKLIGLHGSYNFNGVTSIGAYFVPSTVEAGWNDGKHAKVRSVQLTYDHELIRSIQLSYDGNALPSPLRGSLGPLSAEFTLGSDEYITALSACATTVSSLSIITALNFTTNKSTYGPYGNKNSFLQLSAPPGEQIAGFLGRSGFILNSIDVHYDPVPVSAPQKLDAQGGTRETGWDDGFDHDAVTKIYVRSGAKGIQSVKFDYVKGGEPKQGDIHGSHASCRGSTREFVINHPEEYLVSVEAWHDSSSAIQGIQFKTNHKTSEQLGYDICVDDTKFTLQVEDKRIIGFHGFASDHLTSIGAYFVPITN